MSATTLSVRLRDFSGQRAFRTGPIPANSRVDEVLRDAVEGMELPTLSPQGEAVSYHARLPREGRHLLPAERVGDSLVEEDELVLVPNIDAG